MVKIEGYISKKSILRWLDDYEYMVTGDRSPDALPSNSGPKVYDGWGDSKLNLIMLNDAINKLPPLVFECAIYKWVQREKIKDALVLLEQAGWRISRKVFDTRCKWAVDLIYHQINGDAAAYKSLVEKIFVEA